MLGDATSQAIGLETTLDCRAATIEEIDQLEEVYEGRKALTQHISRTWSHNALRGRLCEALYRLGGLKAQLLHKATADVPGTPFAHKRHDVLFEENGRAPVYIDVRYRHWWSLGKSSPAESFRQAAAASPTGVVNRAWHEKLRGEYKQTENSWPGCELLLGILTTGGRAHPEFAGSL